MSASIERRVLRAFFFSIYELYIEQDEKNNNKLRLIFVLAPLNAKDQEDKMLKILIDYAAIKGPEAKFEVREINTVLQGKAND